MTEETTPVGGTGAGRTGGTAGGAGGTGSAGTVRSSAGAPPRPTSPRRGRGVLEPRDDRVSVFWTLGVTGAFVLILLLAVVGVPSRFLAGPTPPPLPTAPVSPTFSIPVSPSLEIIPPSLTPSASPAT